MGFLDWAAGAYLAGRAHNTMNRPHITVPSGYEIRGMKSRGLSEWTIKYGKIGSNTTSQFNVSRNTRSRTGGWKFTGIRYVLYTS